MFYSSHNCPVPHGNPRAHERLADAVRSPGYHGEVCHQTHYVGSAGIWRFLERVEELQDMPVAIALAGMEAAMPSVPAVRVTGLVNAVTGSSGYGVHRT